MLRLIISSLLLFLLNFSHNAFSRLQIYEECRREALQIGNQIQFDDQTYNELKKIYDDISDNEASITSYSSDSCFRYFTNEINQLEHLNSMLNKSILKEKVYLKLLENKTLNRNFLNDLNEQIRKCMMRVSQKHEDALKAADAAYEQAKIDGFNVVYKYPKKRRDKSYSRSGLKYHVLENKKEKRAIISFSGTDDFFNPDMLTNLLLGFQQTRKSPDYIVPRIIDYIKKGYKVELTGHSLGGLLAQVMGFHFYSKLEDLKKDGLSSDSLNQLEIVTWNSWAGELGVIVSNDNGLIKLLYGQDKSFKKVWNEFKAEQNLKVTHYFLRNDSLSTNVDQIPGEIRYLKEPSVHSAKESFDLIWHHRIKTLLRSAKEHGLERYDEKESDSSKKLYQKNTLINLVKEIFFYGDH